MKKTFTTFANFFAFTNGERRGIVALLSVICFLMLGIQIMPYYSKHDDLEFSDEVLVQSSSSNFETIAGDSAPEGRSVIEPVEMRSPQQESSQPRFQTRERQPFRVHANTADTLDLQQIRGIGSATSHRIVRYREQLGGFVRIEQLLEVFGIDSERYEQIKAFFIIDKQNIQKLNINTISIRELQRHPYLDYWQAKAIVQNRDKNGFYENISDILKLALIDQETFDFIKDYLEL
ncbi:MAG: helix-hairpin-helix domain-containing protein [Bacteroidales bacterium]|nr:helix-hairpin-helix domain-containing protein [Bacteroidales bacterium]